MRAMADRPLLLMYAKCSTCVRAKKWLDAHNVSYDLRAIVDQPPTEAELARWIPASAVPVKKWLNTSGMSYRTLGKPTVDAASDETLRQWLAADGKLVKRPVLVTRGSVVVGFNEGAYAKLFGEK